MNTPSFSLFKPGNSYIGNADRTAREAYIAGYRSSSKILLQNSQSTYELNTLVFPIIFTYRHYLELRLKSIFTGLNYFITETPLMECDEPIKRMIMERHDIQRIWGEILKLKEQLKLVDQAAIFDKSLDLQKADLAIKEFSQADRNSLAFRYSTDRSGQPSLPPNIEWIDANHFVNVMDEVANILEDIDNMIVIANDFRNEFLADFSGYY